MPFPPAGDLLHPGIEPASPVSLALKDGFFTTAPPGRPLSHLSPRLFLRCVLALLLGASQVRCERISAEAALPTCHPRPLLTIAWSHPRRLCPARLPGLTDTAPSSVCLVLSSLLPALRLRVRWSSAGAALGGRGPP